MVDCSDAELISKLSTVNLDDLNHATAVEKAKKAVDELYEFRDHYFAKFGLEKAAQKKKDVQIRMEGVLQLLEKLQSKIINKALFCMLKGKTLNILPDYSTAAMDILSKAVKFDPKLVEAWNNLGECYWKNGNIPSAKNCFTGALNYKKNKESLRNLSMVLRQLSGPPSERITLIEESVEKAKEAIQLDIKDGVSWVILGNAYLSLYFSTGQKPTFLKQSMSAYAQAEKDPIARGNPDLHFNRAVAYKHQEEYQHALEGFTQAGQIDPGWTEAVEKETQLLQFLRTTTEMIQTKGKTKTKKLESFVHSLSSDKDLGPYGGGSYTSSQGQTMKLDLIKFSDLKLEVNEEKVVLGKVVCTVMSHNQIPFTFCMIDSEATCLPVTVYNIASGTGVKIGDSVAIPVPYVHKVNVDHNGEKFSFQSIRVNTPIVMVVNGKKVGVDKQAPIVFSLNAMSD